MAGLFASSEKEKLEYENFNKSQESASSLIGSSIIYSIVAIPYCGLKLYYIATRNLKYELVIMLAILSACDIILFSSLWLICYFKHFTSFRSRKVDNLVDVLQGIFILGFTSYAGLWLLMRLNEGQCEVIISVYDFACNPQQNSDGLPIETILMLMFVPVTFSVILRNTSMEMKLTSWVLTVILILSSSAFINFIPNLPYLFTYVMVSLFFIYETERQNRLIFFMANKYKTLLEENERLADESYANELRHMIGNLAHDLKTPLTSFHSGLEFVTQMFEDLDSCVSGMNNSPSSSSSLLGEAREQLTAIFESLVSIRNTSNFMTMTVNRCIDFAKASKGIGLVPKLETINLSDTLALPLKVMGDMQNKTSITLDSLPDDLCSHVITDQQWLQENLLCLMSNAVKFSVKGSVDVSVSLETRESLIGDGQREIINTRESFGTVVSGGGGSIVASLNVMAASKNPTPITTVFHDDDKLFARGSNEEDINFTNIDDEVDVIDTNNNTPTLQLDVPTIVASSNNSSPVAAAPPRSRRTSPTPSRTFMHPLLSQSSNSVQVHPEIIMTAAPSTSNDDGLNLDDNAAAEGTGGLRRKQQHQHHVEDKQVEDVSQLATHQPFHLHTADNSMVTSAGAAATMGPSSSSSLSHHGNKMRLPSLGYNNNSSSSSGNIHRSSSSHAASSPVRSSSNSSETSLHAAAAAAQHRRRRNHSLLVAASASNDGTNLSGGEDDDKYDVTSRQFYSQLSGLRIKDTTNTSRRSSWFFGGSSVVSKQRSEHSSSSSYAASILTSTLHNGPAAEDTFDFSNSQLKDKHNKNQQRRFQKIIEATSSIKYVYPNSLSGGITFESFKTNNSNNNSFVHKNNNKAISDNNTFVNIAVDNTLKDNGHTNKMMTNKVQPAQEPPKYLKFQITDNGVGLSAAAMENIFSPFKQAQRVMGGTGLGLYSLAKRVEALRGFYGVSNRLDALQGSVFWFAVPYRPDQLSSQLNALTKSLRIVDNQQQRPSAASAISRWSLRGSINSVISGNNNNNNNATVSNSNNSQNKTIEKRAMQYLYNRNNNSSSGGGNSPTPLIVEERRSSDTTVNLHSGGNTVRNFDGHRSISTHSAAAAAVTTIEDNIVISKSNDSGVGIPFNREIKYNNNGGGIAFAATEEESSYSQQHHQDRYYSNDNNDEAYYHQNNQHNNSIAGGGEVDPNNNNNRGDGFNRERINSDGSISAKANGLSGPLTLSERNYTNNNYTNSTDTSHYLLSRSTVGFGGRPLHILIVDDSLSIIKIMSIILRKQGHSVCTAEHGADALEKLENARCGNMTAFADPRSVSYDGVLSGGINIGISSCGSSDSMIDDGGGIYIGGRSSGSVRPFDVVLMDLQMPVMDGLEALRRLRAGERTRNALLKGKLLNRDTNAALMAEGRYEDSENDDDDKWEEDIDLERGGGIAGAIHRQQQQPLNSSSTSPGNCHHHRCPPTKHHFMNEEEEHQKVIAMSANSDSVTMQDALLAGADRFMSKPFYIQTFYQLLQEIS